MKKGTKRSGSTSKIIRDYVAQNPSLGNAQIVKDLVAQGHKVYPALVNQATKRATGTKKRRSSKTSSKRASVKVAASTTAHEEFNIDQFKAAAKFIRLCGSVEAAIASIRQYQKIAELFQ